MAKRLYSFKNGINISPANSLPVNAQNGDIVYLLNEGSFKYFNGTEWKDFGASILYNVTAGENLNALEPVYISKGSLLGDIGRDAGKMYRLDPTNDNRMEYIGLVQKNVLANNTSNIILAGRVDLPVSLIQNGSFANGEMVYWDGIQFTTTAPTNTNFWLIKVGKAISNQSMLINPDLGASAIYVPAANVQNSILNGAILPQSTSFTINPMEYSSFLISYNVKRIAGASEKSESGLLAGHYNSVLGQWSLINYGITGDAEVDFTMVGNTLNYTSSNMIGGPYTGIFDYRVLSDLDVNYDLSDFIYNNMVSLTNINGLFLGPTVKGALISYFVKRETTTPAEEKTESGVMMLSKNSVTNTWTLSTFAVSGDAEISFDVTSGGQIQYVSSNMSGSGYSGFIYWEFLTIF